MENDLKKFLLTKVSKLKLNINDVPDLFKLASKKFSAPVAEIFETMANCFYEREEHTNCLATFDFYARELGLSSEELRTMIVNKYSKQIAQHKINYEHNVELLKNYTWCFSKEFPKFDSLDKILLFHDATKILSLELNTVAINFVERQEVVVPDHNQDAIFTLVGIASLDNLARLEEQINNENEYMGQGGKNPIYLYYENIEEFYLLLMQNSLGNLLNEDRLVFFLAETEVEHFFYNNYSMQPNHFWSEHGKEAWMEILYLKMENIAKSRSTEYKKNIKLNNDDYLNNQDRVLNNIRSKKPKILFVTTRFSTIVQYHTRDCIEACQKLGCEVKLIIEPSDLHRNFLATYSKVVQNFHPDIFFQIDHFANRRVIPQEVIAVNWFQDPLSHLTDPKTPLTLTAQDYMIAANKDGLKEIGYLPEKVLAQKIPANHLIYKPYLLTEEEKEKYSTDIILVANANSFATEATMIETEMFAQLADSEKPVLQKILWEYYQLAYAEKINLATRELVEEYLVRALKTNLKIILTPESLVKLIERFFVHSKAVAFRSILAEWLIDGGYTNLKLYGNDWGNNPKFAPYAMGVAPNGEILAKIYQSAKIVLGSNPHNTGPARVYETFLSGGFYIANYIAPEYDTMNIRDKYIENEEIPFFYNRADLYKKIDYYLANPDERKKITEHIRTKMLENDTYEALMKRMLNWLAEKV